MNTFPALDQTACLLALPAHLSWLSRHKVAPCDSQNELFPTRKKENS